MDAQAAPLYVALIGHSLSRALSHGGDITCVILAGRRCSQNHERKQRLTHTAVGIVPRRVKAQAALSYDVFFGGAAKMAASRGAGSRVGYRRSRATSPSCATRWTSTCSRHPHSTSARRPVNCGSGRRAVSSGTACSIRCLRFTTSRSRSCEFGLAGADHSATGTGSKIPEDSPKVAQGRLVRPPALAPLTSATRESRNNP
jgi:hypothetical protein